MAHYFENLELISMIEKKKDWKSIKNGRKLLLDMLMKSVALYPVTKSTDIARKYMEMMCLEFFEKGDLEKVKGLKYEGGTGREFLVKEDYGVSFIESVGRPLFQAVVGVFPMMGHLMEQLECNVAGWNK
jgi:hypothetical protein